MLLKNMFHVIMGFTLKCFNESILWISLSTLFYVKVPVCVCVCVFEATLRWDSDNTAGAVHCVCVCVIW